MTARSHRDAVRVDMLTIDLRVQQNTNPNRVAEIVKNFNEDALGVITVSLRRDGSMIILDGGHRVAATREVGVPAMEATVFEGLTLEEEAFLFLQLNNKKNPDAITKFRVRTVSGEPVACEITKIIESLGWQVRQDGRRGSITAVTAIERVYRGANVHKRGEYPELLRWSINLLTEAWGMDSAAVHQGLVQGAGQLRARFDQSIDEEKLIREMQGTNPRSILGKARSLADAQRGTLPAAVAGQLTALHNLRRRTNLLPEWRWRR